MQEAWYFETKSTKQGSAYDYFNQSMADPSLLNDLGLDDNMKEVVVENIQRKLRSGLTLNALASLMRELCTSKCSRKSYYKCHPTNKKCTKLLYEY